MYRSVLLRCLLVFSWTKPTDFFSNTVLQCPTTSVDAEIGDTVILQCSTSPPINVNDMMVEWMVNDKVEHVHAQRLGKQKLGDQLKEYRGRTALFDSELPKGNCSLRLTVKMSDSGKYLCSVIGEEILSCFTYLTVHEPVKINSSGLFNKPRDIISSDPGQPGGDGNNTSKDTSAFTPHVIVAISVIGVIIIIAVVIWKCRKPRRNQNNQNKNEVETPLRQNVDQNALGDDNV